MLGEQRFRQISELLLRRSTADETEVVLLGTDSALTRFANSEIHQNVAERDASIRLRVVIGRRVGVATTNDISETALSGLLERAETVARLLPETPDFPGLPDPGPVCDVVGFSQATADCRPARRAQMVREICAPAVEAGIVASGALSTDHSEVGVANSRGVFAHTETTRAHLVTVVMDDEGSGYAERTALSVDDVDAELAGREAIERAVRSRGPTLLEPGEYPVVLEEYAVGEVMTYLAYMGFGAQSYQEGYSFMRGKLGERIVDHRISVWDDGLDPRGLPLAFDYEGVPRRRVDIIRGGVASAVVYDTQTAARDGVASTGHALPAPNTFGPFPSHLFLSVGDTPKLDLATGVDRGVWVTRFHYVNVAKPDQAILTGMTRDGTFLIERGEITRPIKNLRFTQSIVDAWSDLGALSDSAMLIDAWGGAVSVPAMRLNRFAFTGVTGSE